MPGEELFVRKCLAQTEHGYMVLHNAEGFGNLIIAWRNGSPVRLNEVADVVDSVENALP